MEVQPAALRTLSFGLALSVAAAAEEVAAAAADAADDADGESVEDMEEGVRES